MLHIYRIVPYNTHSKQLLNSPIIVLIFAIIEALQISYFLFGLFSFESLQKIRQELNSNCSIYSIQKLFISCFIVFITKSVSWTFLSNSLISAEG